MLSFFGINKILAVMVGPAGFTIVGQFQNLVQMITTFSSGAVTTGVTKYTAQEINDEKFQITLWKTAGTISIVGSFLTAMLVWIFEIELSDYFLKNSELAIVFRWFAAFLIPFVLNSLLLAILNGRKEIRTYVVCNISGSVLSLILTVVLAYFFELNGALIALGTYQSVAFFLTH